MTTSATEGGGVPVLVGGYPDEEDVSRLYDELDYQRACQAYIR
jgi:hypothetical protein